MKIKVNTHTTDIETISSGECFWWAGSLYMVIKLTTINDTSKVSATMLNNGAVKFFDTGTQVEKADCVVIAE